MGCRAGGARAAAHPRARRGGLRRRGQGRHRRHRGAHSARHLRTPLLPQLAARAGLRSSTGR
eukprot:8605125-Lingulodinium_polyedra.AAC.1